jgi:hypothetical protein
MAVGLSTQKAPEGREQTLESEGKNATNGSNGANRQTRDFYAKRIAQSF